MKHLIDYLEEHLDKSDTIIIDTETSSLHPHRDGQILAGVAFKPLGHEEFYVPVFHGSDAQPGYHGSDDPHNVDISILESLLAYCIVNKKKIVMHNVKFDTAVLYQEGFDFIHSIGVEIYDTVVLMRLISENEPSYELKELAFRYISEDARKEQNIIHKYMRDHNLDNYAQIPANIMAPYARKDVEYTEWLYLYAMERIEKRGLQELLKLEQDVTKCLFDVEERGFLIDRKFVERRITILNKDWKEAESVCYKQVKKLLNQRWKIKKTLPDDEIATLKIAIELLKEQDGTFEIHNAYDVRKVFHGIGIRSGVLTDKGGESWNKIALKKVAKNHPDKIARLLATKISIWRALNKILNNYYGIFIKLMDKDNFVHTSIHQAGARTGRMSAREPPLQTIPKEGTFELLEVDEDDKGLTEVRDAFIARPGYFLLMADWSQIELRILAEYADEEIWKRAVKYGVDLHKVAARASFGEEPIAELENYQWRQDGKNLNFAVVYGVGNVKLGKAINSTKEEAKKFKNTYFKRYPNVKTFANKAQSVCEQRMMRVCKLHTNPICQECEVWTNKGWVKNKYGRRRYLELDKTYVAINFLIQGSNADLLKDVFRRIHWGLDKYDSGVVDLVHDEVISEVSYQETDKTIETIVREMQTTDRFDIPIKVGLQWSPTTWGQPKSLDCKTCKGHGKIFPFPEIEMAELLFQEKWDIIEQAGIEVCSDCDGKGYDTKEIHAYWEELQTKD